jgi:hypothetical protein
VKTVVCLHDYVYADLLAGLQVNFAYDVLATRCRKCQETTIQVNRMAKESQKGIILTQMSWNRGGFYLLAEIFDYLRANPDVLEWLYYYPKLRVQIPFGLYGLSAGSVT